MFSLMYILLIFFVDDKNMMYYGVSHQCCASVSQSDYIQHNAMQQAEAIRSNYLVGVLNLINL